MQDVAEFVKGSAVNSTLTIAFNYFTRRTKTITVKIIICYAIHNLLVSIASIFQIAILIADKTCDKNGVPLTTSFALLAISLLLCTIPIYIAREINKIQWTDMFSVVTTEQQYNFKRRFISRFICIFILWITQFALIIQSFVGYCPVVATLYIIFFIWMILTIIIFIFLCFTILHKICLKDSIQTAIQCAIGTTQFIISLTTCCLEIHLILNYICDRNLWNLYQAICLLLFVILSKIINVFLQIKKRMSNVSILENLEVPGVEDNKNDNKNTYGITYQCAKIIDLIIFFIQYFFIIIAINVAFKYNIGCSDMKEVRTVTFVLFIIWFISYSAKMFILIYCFIQYMVEKCINSSKDSLQNIGSRGNNYGSINESEHKSIFE
eukprot:136978_1